MARPRDHIEEPPAGDLLSALTLDETQPEEDAPQEKPPRQRLGLVLLAVLLAGFVTLAWFTLRIKTVEVRGNVHLTSDEILQMANLQTGGHMWLAKLGEAERALLEDPYIATARVRRIYPSTVRITVSERQEAAVILGMSAVAIVDDQGYVLSIGERTDYTGLLKVYGAGASGYRVNGRIGDVSDFTSRTMLELINAIQESGLGSLVASVDVSNALSVTMQTTSGFTVQMGQPERFAEKLYKLAVVLPEVQKLGYTAGTIDVSGRGDPVFSPPAATAADMADPIEDVLPDDTDSNVIPADNPDPSSAPEPSPTPE